MEYKIPGFVGAESVDRLFGVGRPSRRPTDIRRCVVALRVLDEQRRGRRGFPTRRDGEGRCRTGLGVDLFVVDLRALGEAHGRQRAFPLHPDGERGRWPGLGADRGKHWRLAAT